MSIAVFSMLGIAFGALLAMTVVRMDRIRSAAGRDSLTGLANRDTMTDAVEREVQRARRYGTPFALLIFDVDRFKDINDTHGHDTGDAILREVAHVAGDVVRGSDTLGRWGGDEFVILAPATDAGGCRALAERVRAAVDRHRFARGVTVTLSLGMAQFSAEDDVNTLFRRADEAMYRAKRAGRNRCEADGSRISTGPALRILK